MAGDIDALVKLRLAFLSEGSGKPAAVVKLAGAIRNYFSRMIPAGAFVAAIAETGGEIVGTSGMVYDRHPPLLKNPTGLCPYIMNMYVRPEFRRRGVATRLLKMLLAEAKKSGGRSVTLHFWPGKSEFYAKVGFRRREREMVLELGSR